VDFYDTFEHTIDGKGRLVLPASFRSAFADGGFVTYLGKYAALFTTDEWQKYRRRLEQSGQFTREQLQYLFSFVTPFQPDAQNRIGISQRLRDKVGLDRDVTIVGSGSHAALYAREAWRVLEESIEESAEDGTSIVDKFSELEFL
jgi:MraZ protein